MPWRGQYLCMAKATQGHMQEEACMHACMQRPPRRECWCYARAHSANSKNNSFVVPCLFNYAHTVKLVQGFVNHRSFDT